MHRVVALAFVVNVPIGIHDFYIMRIADSFTNQALLRYSATLFGLALGAIAIDRFRTANLRVRDMLDSLSVRVQRKDLELSQSYQRMELIAREQARTQERAQPTVRLFAMVLIAPAPGVSEISSPAPTRANHNDHGTAQD